MGWVANKKDLQSSFYHEDRGAAVSSPSSDQGSYATYEEDINCGSTALLMDHKTAGPPLHSHTAFHSTGVDLGFRHHLSLINFKSNETATTTTTEDDCFRHDTAGAGGSLLSFQQEPAKNNMDPSSSAFMWKDDHIAGEGNNNNNTTSFGNNCGYNLRQGMNIMNNDLKSGAPSETRLIDDINTYQPPSTSYAWLYSDSTTVVTAHRVQETRHQGSSSSPLLLKRPHHMGDDHSMPSSKKQCTAGSGSSSAKNSKSKQSTSSNKDPQSLAAKNRRERISERLKVLQELVPNGPKVDLVTMLEKAISYVKFLQLQVKVLATDEFWPAQGGKAPDVSQVKEAIDAILASQRERSSSSK